MACYSSVIAVYDPHSNDCPLNTGMSATLPVQRNMPGAAEVWQSVGAWFLQSTGIPVRTGKVLEFHSDQISTGKVLDFFSCT
jgi:hypothetical protein